MKKVMILLLFSIPAWARPVILISYYDAFDKASFNNSEKIAKGLESSISNEDEFEIKLCPLNTIFDKAYAQTENCLKEMKTSPIMVLGLGEYNCDMKIETVFKNKDKTSGPDNAGNEREDIPILSEGPEYLGTRLPLLSMYCSLNKKERNDIEISNSAGSFVCNNTAYQLSYYYPELISGFIHVPANHCRNLERKNKQNIENLKTMLSASIKKIENESYLSSGLPHPSNQVRWPIRKKELNVFRKKYEGQENCEQEFFKRSRGVDEKGFWSFLKIN